MTAPAAFLQQLRSVVGRRHVLTSDRATLRYRRGFRTDAGKACAVVRPGTLVELWRVLEACSGAAVAIVMQAANTGLTGGSTPNSEGGQPAVIINTMRLDRIHLVAGGAQVVCLPGVTLHQLERTLRPLAREPHSVIGSSCFGASVVGGVCNSSGGALVRRGPAYTEMAIYAQVDETGKLVLANRLGFDLGDDPETMLERLERGQFDASVANSPASDPDYASHVRKVEEPTPARFNADPRRLYDASGSAGKIAVFAVQLDTFEKPGGEVTLYIGTNSMNELTALRRSLLTEAKDLPISAEYLHADTFDIANCYGRDTFYIIRWLGTDRLPMLFAAKARFDALAGRFGITNASDRVLQGCSRIMPSHLPRLLLVWRNRFEHHLILKVARDDLETTKTIVEGAVTVDGGWFECSPDEAAKAALHRFVAAGAAVRMAAVQTRRVGAILALDVALPRNAQDWFGDLPADLRGKVRHVLRYGHFLCHVFHRDYLLAPGANSADVKQRLLEVLDRQGAEYPAEHNVGRQYRAKPALADFYQSLDPTNRFNPGIGHTSRFPHWREHAEQES